MTMRPVYLFICGLFFAGIIHIIIILLIPAVGSKDAARRISQSIGMGQFERIEDGGTIGIADTDPFFEMSVCRFDLTASALLVSGPPAPTFWSASVFDQNGEVVYSLNDRTAIRNQLKLIVVNPIQMADLRQTQPEEIETSIIVEASSTGGFVLLRALVRDQSWRATVAGFLDQATCQPYLTR